MIMVQPSSHLHSLPLSSLFLRLKLTKVVCHTLRFRRANGPDNNLTWFWRPGHLSHRTTEKTGILRSQ